MLCSNLFVLQLGIEKIHLLASTMKAPPSKVSEDDWVVMVVTRETPFQKMHLQMSKSIQSEKSESERISGLTDCRRTRSAAARQYCVAEMWS